MCTDLKFESAWTPSAGHDVRLTFGASPDETPGNVSADIQIRLGPPNVRIQAHYDNRVSRKCEGGNTLGWNTALRAEGGGAGAWVETRHERPNAVLNWNPALQLANAYLVSGEGFLGLQGEGHAGWREGIFCGRGAIGTFGLLAPHREDSRLPWAQGLPTVRRVMDAFVSLLPRRCREETPWQSAVRRQMHWRSGFSPGTGTTRQWEHLWTVGRQPLPGQSRLPLDPVTPPLVPQSHPQLDFRVPATQAALAWRPLLRLDFGAVQPGPVAIPILKVYFVSNHVEMLRLPGREPLPVKSVQISIDADSWAWGLTATLAYSALDKVLPDGSGGAEVEITINGARWVMLVEGFEVRREFGQSSLTVQGRSRAAYLAAPYAPVRSYVAAAPATAQQLAVQELTRAGFESGFDLDWQLPDWLVPEGAWSYDNLTPIAAIGRIVGAVGGTLNAHPCLDKLIARSRYPALPWEWEAQTPDVALPIDFVKTLGLRWQEKPAYNAVFVSGEHVGVAGQVIRAGSAGDLLAPMVVDALITHADAARERGRAVLADTGRQASVTLELPMPETLGLITPGTLVAVSEAAPEATWRGLVRATRISAEWNTCLTVRQSLELERPFF